MLPFIRRIEKVFAILQYFVSAIGYPEYNPRRTDKPGQLTTQLRWTYTNETLNGEQFGRTNLKHIEGRISGRWIEKTEIAQPGGFCGQRRLFVMKPDFQEANQEQGGRNWQKIAVP